MASVTNPLSNLGPAPRIGSMAQPQGGAGVMAPAPMEFFSAGPTGPMQPGSFASTGVAPSFAPVGAVAPPVTGQIGQMQPGNFPPPGSATPGGTQSLAYVDDPDNEPPLLEELGINVEHIVARIKGVAFFQKVDEETLRDADLCGPVAIVLCLAGALLLTGKLVFGYIYGLVFTSAVGIWLIINMMSQRGGIDIYRTSSILGYGLIPIVLLALIGVIVTLRSSFGTVVSAACIFWATATSSRFFAAATQMQQQRWLVAYPIGLVYTCFTLITIF